MTHSSSAPAMVLQLTIATIDLHNRMATTSQKGVGRIQYATFESEISRPTVGRNSLDNL